MMDKASNGRYYGTIEVLLTRETTSNDKTFIEVMVGYASPFGGISVRRPDTKKYGPPEAGTFWADPEKRSVLIEEAHSYWEAQGFEITEPAVLDRIRDGHRKALSDG